MTTPKEYPAHQQRVIDEKIELDKKIEALHKFVTDKGPIYSGLPQAEKTRLHNQKFVMVQYSNILLERIEEFTQ